MQEEAWKQNNGESTTATVPLQPGNNHTLNTAITRKPNYKHTHHKTDWGQSYRTLKPLSVLLSSCVLEDTQVYLLYGVEDYTQQGVTVCGFPISLQGHAAGTLKVARREYLHCQSYSTLERGLCLCGSWWSRTWYTTRLRVLKHTAQGANFPVQNSHWFSEAYRTGWAALILSINLLFTSIFFSF